MATAMPQRYSKVHKTIPEQIGILERNGMDVSGLDASELLKRVGYYRLSGYWYPFRTFKPDHALNAPQRPRMLDDHSPDYYPYGLHNVAQKRWNNEIEAHNMSARSSQFEPGTSLKQIELIYEFDREIRMRLFHAIEIVEGAIRYRFSYHLGQTDAFAHRDPANFSDAFTQHSEQSHYSLRTSRWQTSDHASTLRLVDKSESRSKETFVKHYQHKYGGPLPVWMAQEIMSFGELIRFYDGLNTALKNTIAAELGVRNSAQLGDGATLSTWLNHLRTVQNICAHHSRIWNKTLSATIGIPHQIEPLRHLQNSRTRDRMYATVSILRFLLATIKPASTWAQQTISFISTSSEEAGIDLDTLWFPEEWANNTIWQESFAHDLLAKNGHHAIMDKLPYFSRSEAKMLLFPDQNAPTQRSRVRSLVSDGQLLSLSLGGPLAFPKFQFIPEDTVRQEKVFSINRTLIGRTSDNDERSKKSWAAAVWWTALGRSEMTPVEALENGTLADSPWDDYPFSATQSGSNSPNL